MSNNKLKLNGDKTHLMLLATDKAWKNKLNENSISLDTGNEMVATTDCEKMTEGKRKMIGLSNHEVNFLTVLKAYHYQSCLCHVIYAANKSKHLCYIQRSW